MGAFYKTIGVSLTSIAVMLALPAHAQDAAPGGVSGSDGAAGATPPAQPFAAGQGSTGQPLPGQFSPQEGAALEPGGIVNEPGAEPLNAPLNAPPLNAPLTAEPLDSPNSLESPIGAETDDAGEAPEMAQPDDGVGGDPIGQSPVAADDFSAGATDFYEDQRELLGDDADDPIGFGVLAMLGLHVQGAMATEYSDNIARSGSNNGGARGDWRFRPSLNVDGGHAIGSQLLFFSASVGRDYYARRTDLNRSRYRIAGGLQWALGQRCGGRFQAGYSSRSRAFDDFDLVEPGRSKRLSLMAAATCRTSAGLGASLTYGYVKRTNTPAAVRSFADSRAHTIDLSLSYAVGNRGEVGTRLGYTDVTNPNQDFGPFGIGGTRIKTASAFGQYRLTPAISVDGSIGYTKADPKILLAQGFSGMTWNAGAQYRGPKIRVRGSLGRSVSSGRSGQSNLRASRFYSLTAHYDASDRLGIGAGFTHTDYSNRGTSMLVNPGSLAEYKMDRWHLGGNYRLNRIVSTSLSYRHRKRTTDQTIFDYSENAVIFTVRAGF